MSLFGVAVLAIPTTIFAQGGGADSGQAGNQDFGTPLSSGSGNLLPPTYNTSGSGGGGADSGQAAAAVEPADTSLIDLGSPIYNMLFAFVVTVFGKIFSWSGALFDMGLSTFVLGFGDLYYNQNVGVSVEEVWKIIRDLFNLTFIFGLVMIGFKMILDSNDSKARSTLVSLIGAALLVNFSLFITKFVIDIANVTASVVAKGFGGENIANGFINLIKISTFLNIDASQIGALQTGGAFGYIFGLLIFFAVAAFVFAAGGILMIIRFVTLCAYMVFSPVMFIGWVFPSLGKHSSKYWSGFLGQAFFAPAYLLMLYLSFKVMASYRDQIGVVDYGQLFAAGPELAGTAARAIPFFVMTMVFLVMSLVVAKNMGAVGASTAISIGNKLVGGAKQRLGSATFGLAAATGRNTVGAGASAIANRPGFKDFTAKYGRVGRSLSGAVDKVADSSFDARKVGGVGKMMGIGEGKKGGFTTGVKEQKEADEKFLKKLGTRDADTYDPKTKEAKAELDRLEELADQTTDPTLRDQYTADAKKAKKDYNDAKKKYSAKEEYARQLSYISSIENWKKKQAAVAAVAGGAAAGLLTGGVVPIAAGIIAGGVIGAGNHQHNKQTTGAMRKDYGKNGLKKRKHDHEEHALKKTAAAIGGGDHDTHDKPKTQKEEEKHEEPKAKAAPAADNHAPASNDNHAPSGGGGDHGHH